MTIKGLTVNKTGNKIELKIGDCERSSDALEVGEDNDPYFTKSASGYTAHIDVNQDQNLIVKVYDLMGRITEQKNVSLVTGTNTFEIPSAGFGIFIVELNGNSVSHAEKLLF
jgi:hypothetical protein